MDWRQQQRHRLLTARELLPLRKNISTKTVSGDIGMRPHALLTFITVTHL